MSELKPCPLCKQKVILGREIITPEYSDERETYPRFVRRELVPAERTSILDKVLRKIDEMAKATPEGMARRLIVLSEVKQEIEKMKGIVGDTKKEHIMIPFENSNKDVK